MLLGQQWRGDALGAATHGDDLEKPTGGDGQGKPAGSDTVASRTKVSPRPTPEDVDARSIPGATGSDVVLLSGFAARDTTVR